jgi:hypothetical protein
MVWQNGVVFIRYDEDRKPIVTKQKLEDGEDVLKVSVYDPIIGEQLLLDADLIVISVAIVAPTENAQLAQMLKVPVNEDGFFLEAHVKLRPVGCFYVVWLMDRNLSRRVSLKRMPLSQEPVPSLRKKNLKLKA